ncbi:MAG: Gfo/Idh/MocA family oxidoreductase [Deinococcales bacterium]
MIQTIGIIMNGVTGRMGKNQHLMRSIVALRQQGGLLLPNGERLMPDPILIGRDAKKLEALAKEANVSRWSTDLDAALANPDDRIYFDAVLTQHRAENIKKAIAAGKHIYTEKPIAEGVEEALELARLAHQAGVKNGAVHDKLYLQGLQKLKRLVDGGFFGRILSVRGEFGYWVFEGDWQTAQRPSWNYRKEEGGGIIVDMLCHWRYVLDNIFGAVKSVNCLGATHIAKRWDEASKAYEATADDAAYAMFELEGGIIAQINSSWCTRVYRDELVSFQVDGTEGSAVAGLRECKIQHRSMTPKPVWNPDIPSPINFYSDWKDVPNNQDFDNGFKLQWESFLRHVVLDTPYQYDLLEGAKGVQLAELGLKSWQERRWLDVPELRL